MKLATDIWAVVLIMLAKGLLAADDSTLGIINENQSKSLTHDG